MKTPVRIAVTSFATIVAFYGLGWFGLLAWIMVTARLRGSVADFTADAWVQGICSVVGAAVAGWYTWRKTGAEQKSRPGVVATTLQWAFMVGGIGFALGFFGPMIFLPGANQGPMLGVFITGPLGFVGGAVGGLVRALRTTSQASRQPH